MATTSETPCSRCPGNCFSNTCLPSTAKPAPGRPGPNRTEYGRPMWAQGRWTRHPRGDGLREGSGEGEKNKLNPQVLFSLPTSPHSNCGSLVADRMGLSGAKRQLPW